MYMYMYMYIYDNSSTHYYDHFVGVLEFIFFLFLPSFLFLYLFLSKMTQVRQLMNSIELFSRYICSLAALEPLVSFKIEILDKHDHRIHGEMAYCSKLAISPGFF